jgi:hypothetical protein
VAFLPHIAPLWHRNHPRDKTPHQRQHRLINRLRSTLQNASPDNEINPIAHSIQQFSVKFNIIRRPAIRASRQACDYSIQCSTSQPAMRFNKTQNEN